MESTEAVQQKVEVPKVDLGSTDTFTREQVEGIVAKALESEITGLKSNNIALKEERRRPRNVQRNFRILFLRLEDRTI